MEKNVEPLTDDELARLRKCADTIPTDDEWFTLGDPWLGGGMETQVIARSPDPHVAVVVCDMLDLASAGHEDEFSDDEWHARNWANAEFIATFDPPTVKLMLATIRRAEQDNKRLREALGKCTGYLLNAKIDIETGAPRKTALATIEGGLNMARAALKTGEQAL